MNIYKVFDLLERIEREMADLYRKLRNDHLLNREAADFFLDMQLEEEAHLQIVRMERRIVQSLPKAFREPQVNMSAINSLLESIRSLKGEKLELPALIGRIYGIESGAAENYLIEAMQNTNDELREFLMNIANEWSRHLDKVAVFAKSRGVKIEDIQNRQLRKARVGYGEKVVIDGRASARGVDISESGMFLLTSRTAPDGQRLSLEFTVSGTPVTTTAEVQYSIEGTGMGVMFTGLGEGDRKLVAEYVERRIQELGMEQEVRLLFVTDHHMTGRTIRIYRNGLLNEGFRVVDVSGFEEAASILRKGLDLSAVILSLDTESEGNYYLLHFLATIERYRNLPLLVLTDNADPAFREQMAKQGVAGLVSRETESPRRLIEEIKVLVGK